MSRRLKALLLSAVLIVNLAIAPFLQFASSPTAETRRAPIAVADSSSNADVAVSSMGLFGLDTLWNGIKGFFNAMGSFADGILEISTCVAEWSRGGNILIAIAVCPGISMINVIVKTLVIVFEGMFEVRIFSDSGVSEIMKSVHSEFMLIANSIFIIIFLIMIISMLTSMGLSNYHVKKMAPKLAIVAVVINTSFFICAAMVDLSNIAGAGLKDMIGSMGRSAVIDYECTKAHKGDEVKIDSCKSGGGLSVGDKFSQWAEDMVDNASPATVLGDAAGFTNMYTVTSLIVLVIVIMMIIAVITVPILAAIRMILCIFFVIVSPVAFVLILHPKGQPLFMKWFKEFGRLLLIYPAFGVFVGLSQIAVVIFYRMETVKHVVGGAPGDTVPDLGLVLMKITGIMIALASPVLFIKPLMKSTSRLMAAASNKVDGVIKGAVAIGATAATMGGAAAVAGPGLMAKSMAALKSAPGMAGRLGQAWEGKGNRDLKLGRRTRSAKVIADRGRRDRLEGRTADLTAAELSGDKARADMLRMEAHNEQVKEHTTALAGVDNDTLATARSSSNAAIRQAAWGVSAERKIIPKETAADSLVSADSMAAMGSMDRAAAIQQNKAIADTMQAVNGDGLVNGGLHTDMVNGVVSNADELNKRMVENFGKMSEMTVASDGKALSTMNKLAGGGDSGQAGVDAKAIIDRLKGSMLQSGEVRVDLKQYVTHENAGILKATSPINITVQGPAPSPSGPARSTNPGGVNEPKER